jgi:hypothetical protein
VLSPRFRNGPKRPGKEVVKMLADLNTNIGVKPGLKLARTAAKNSVKIALF